MLKWDQIQKIPRTLKLCCFLFSNEHYIVSLFLSLPLTLLLALPLYSLMSFLCAGLFLAVSLFLSFYISTSLSLSPWLYLIIGYCCKQSKIELFMNHLHRFRTKKSKRDQI